MTIRRALIGDIPAIRSVLAVTWRDTYSAFLSKAVIAKVTAEWHSPQILEAETNRPSTFLGVAETGSHGIVGMITAHSQDDILSITRLYVLPQFQCQGFGQRLMEESWGAFPQTRRVRLDVEEQNPTGRSFYGKLGFAEVGARIDDVGGSKVNSIVMEKVANPNLWRLSMSRRWLIFRL
ncbi:MAG TPA: GNAT family N-acetyltransferase [Candidatus Binatia bacterium]|nr:GNAT family N-acetyltransferase [Candidatus Binatia bacterium]